MENIAKACIFVGAMLAGIGGIMGALFMTSDDFVEARISCLQSSGNPECPTDGFVQFNGKDCLVGTLGLFDSSFTPNCADGTPYAISEAVDEFEGDPLEFGPLFPAQTGLAGILNDFEANGGGAVPGFESCETYFADGGAIEAYISGNAFQNVLPGLPAVGSTLQTFYFAITNQLYDATEALFVNAGEDLANIAWGTLIANGCVTPAPLPTNLSGSVFYNASLVLGPCDTFGGVASLTTTFSALITVNAGSFSPVGLLFQALLGAGGAIEVIEAASTGLAVGSVDEGGPLQTIAATGMWTQFQASGGAASACFLCQNTGFGGETICSYIDVLVGLTTLIEPLLSPAAQTSIASLRTFWQSTEAGLIDQLGPFGVTDRDSIENIIDSGVVNAVSTSTAFAALKASTVNSVTPLTGAPPFPGFGGLIENYTEAFSASESTSINSLSLFCGLLGQPDCNWQELIAGAGALVTDPGLLGQLSVLSELMAACQATVLPVPDTVRSEFVTCAGFAGSTTPLTALGGLTLPDTTAVTIIGTLYSAINTTSSSTLDEVFAAAIPECQDDEKDAEAIEAAQQLAPAGTALIFIGTLVGLLSIAKPVPSKIGGIVAAVIGVIGGILFLMALLGVQQAPVFEAVGDDGPIEDGAIVYETGAAALLAAGTVGLGIAGPIILGAGFVLLPPPAEGADIMSGGKY